MTINERLGLAARVAACALAGSLAGFLAWTIGALGLGSLAWAAPLLLVAMLAFGLPSFGLLIAVAWLCACSIRRRTAEWCVALPLAATLAWRVCDAGATLPADGDMLVALCAVASSTLFFAWTRYLGLPGEPAALSA